ncbi:hypothetical protein Aperf_G00000101322 [Anoplocephala perfoliata]
MLSIQFVVARRQPSITDKGVLDRKELDNPEIVEFKFKSRMGKLKWSKEPLDNDAFRQTRQHKQIDQNQQTTITSDFPVMTNLKHGSFPAGAGGITRGVKPFVKQWVERQNQAFIGYCVEQTNGALQERKTHQLTNNLPQSYPGGFSVCFRTMLSPSLSFRLSPASNAFVELSECNSHNAASIGIVGMYIDSGVQATGGEKLVQ